MKRKMPSFMNDKPAKDKNPFVGKESAKEEAAERKKFPSKKAYAKAEAKFEGEKMPKFACGGKVKRYADGGEIEEGPNENISDDTRARAMKFARGEMGSEAPAKPSSKAAPKPAPKPAPRSAGTPAGTGSAMREEAPSKPTFSRVPGPAAGSRADKAIKTYEAPTDDQYAGLKAAAPAAAALASPALLRAGATRAAGMARGMAKAPSAPPAEIGKRATQGVDEAMFARTAETAKKATSAARSAAGKKADRAMTAPKKPKASPRARTRGNPEEAGVEFKSGGSVRGGGAAKRGVGRGKMC